MVGAGRAHRRRIFRRVLHDGDDVIHRIRVDDDPRMRDKIAEPVGYFRISQTSLLGRPPPTQRAVRQAIARFACPLSGASAQGSDRRRPEAAGAGPSEANAKLIEATLAEALPRLPLPRGELGSANAVDPPENKA